MRSLTAQICVIGSGAGGSAAAATLAAGGKDVLLLEAGEHHDPAAFDQRESTMMRRLYADAGMRMNADQSMIIMSGRGLGGSTIHNTGLAVPAPRAVLERWADLGGLPLSVEAFEQRQRDVMGRLGARLVDEDEINANNRVLRDGARETGLRWEVAHHNRERCSGCGYCMIGCAYNRKRNALFAWLEQGVRDGLRIVTGAPVERIRELRGEVEVRTQELVVRAGAVVVAASALETPALLLRSGLGNRRALGRTLRLHPFAPVAAEFDRSIEAWRGVPQSILVTGGARFLAGERGGWILMAGAAGPAATASMVPGHGDEVRRTMGAYPRLAFAGVLLHDEGVQRVRSRRGGRPVIHAWPRGSDARGLLEGVRVLGELMFAAGAKTVSLPFARGGRVTDVARLRQLDSRRVRRHDMPLTSVHPQGSAPMGSASTAAVRPDGRLRGASRVWVADASLFPTSVGVPPQVAIMSYGAAVAEGMLAEHAS